jgi:hypothetical protein
MTPDGRRAVSTSVDGTLKVWDLSAHWGESATAHGSNHVMALAVSPAGALVTSTSFDCTRIWELATGRALHTMWTGGWATCVAVSGDGRLAVGDHYLDGVITLSDLVSGVDYTLRDGPKDHVMAVAMTPDGHRAIGSLLHDGIVVLDLPGSPRQLHDTPKDPALDVAISPDGSLALASHSIGGLKVWDLASGRVRRHWKHEDYGFSKVAVSAVGLGISYRQLGESLHVWSLTDGAEIAAIGHVTGFATGVTIAPNGRWAATSSYGGIVRLWDLESRAQVAAFRCDHHVGCCAVSHDGKTVVAGDSMGHLHFLRVEGVLDGPSAADAPSRETGADAAAIARMRREAEELRRPGLDPAMLSAWVRWRRATVEEEWRSKSTRCAGLREILDQIDASVHRPYGPTPPEELRRRRRERDELAPQVTAHEKDVARLEAGLTVLRKAEDPPVREKLESRRRRILSQPRTFAEVIDAMILRAGRRAVAAYFLSRAAGVILRCAWLACGLQFFGILWYWSFHYIPWQSALSTGVFPRTASRGFQANMLAALAATVLSVPTVYLTWRYIVQFLRNDPSLQPSHRTARALVAGLGAYLLFCSLAVLASTIPYGFWAFPVVVSGVVSRPPSFPARLVPENFTIIVGCWSCTLLRLFLAPLKSGVASIWRNRLAS